ncbi:TolB-like 6-bladed beta-propeller domain-containing protein [Echinicola marina]|uniref:BF3164 family lipoprotein n=1 Tax=Echinicola marina TaxID=2859768 RepID=UPI001CF6B8F5|nr:BF3164 family lipoprotein [Echinicola marina]UCS95056.1 TolB-like 6-bladed beta-propeller domain-containing protein [Echinicola marina]
MNNINFSSTLFVFALLITIFSCGKENEESKYYRSFEFESVDDPIHLRAKKYNFKELINPKKIELKNELIIIGESRRINDYNSPIHLIDKRNLKYFSGKGKIGFGPGEISDAYGIDASGEDSVLWVYSSLEKRFSKFNIYDKKHLSEDQIKQAENFFMATAMAWSSDSSVVCRMANDSCKFVEFNIDGTRLGSYGLWQDLNVGKDLNDFNMAELHLGWFKGSKNRDIFVNASYYRDHIEIFNRNEGMVYSVDGPRNEIPEFHFVSGGKGKSSVIIIDEENPVAYRDIYIGEQYIYGLYSGYTRKEMLREGKFAQDIFIFNLKGEFRSSFTIDIPIRALAVDEQSRKIYGITADENPGIAVFEMPK